MVVYDFFLSYSGKTSEYIGIRGEILEMGVSPFFVSPAEEVKFIDFFDNPERNSIPYSVNARKENSR